MGFWPYLITTTPERYQDRWKRFLRAFRSFLNPLGLREKRTTCVLEPLDIKYGFLKKSEKELEDICNNEKITVSNTSKSSGYLYPWKKSAQKEVINVSYQQSLVLDIWKHIFSKF